MGVLLDFFCTHLISLLLLEFSLYSCLPQLARPVFTILRIRTPKWFCVLNLQPNLWHKVTFQLPRLQWLLAPHPGTPVTTRLYCCPTCTFISCVNLFSTLFSYSAPIQTCRQILKMPDSWNPECFPHPLPMGEKMSIPWRFVFVPETWSTDILLGWPKNSS